MTRAHGGPPSPRGPTLCEAVSLEPRALEPLPRERSGGSRQHYSPPEAGFLPQAQPQALLSVSTVSSREKPQV